MLFVFASRSARNDARNLDTHLAVTFTTRLDFFTILLTMWERIFGYACMCVTMCRNAMIICLERATFSRHL